MATPQTVTLYDRPIPGAGGARLQLIGMSVADAPDPPDDGNSIILLYVVQLSPGPPPKRVALSREDWLAVRLTLGMPTP